MEDNGNGKIKLYERVATLEQCYKDLCEDFTEVKAQVTNHIPTQLKEIKTEFNKCSVAQNTKLNWILGIFVTILIALVGNLILRII
jgi:hypothetical protein